jgi:chromosomal replication initiator protein
MNVPGETNTWERVQTLLRQRLDEHSYKNWFSQTHLASAEQGRLTVNVPTQFFADWLREHYRDVIHGAVKSIDPAIEEVSFQVSGAHALADGEPERPVVARRIFPKASPDGDTRFDGFNAKYTFERFVVGSGNRFAHAAAKAVAEAPARSYNPLFLYGGTGLGKTHLMQAIGHQIVQQQPNANVAILTSETFTNQLIEAIAKKSTQRFRAKYRRADVLMVDDIHFIAGKEATQEEFFHTFNALFEGHKQIVMSSDRAPKEIKGLEDRLLSRFEWGLVTDIQPPDLETRLAILQNRVNQEELTITQEATRYIATYITNNIRELEGALITVAAFSKLVHKPIDLPMVEDVLKDLIGKEVVRPITIDLVLRVVGEHYDVRLSDLKGRSRQRQIAMPRQIAMYLCKALVPSLSLTEIGEALGGKDHTTVIHACRKVARESAHDVSLKKTLEHLEKLIRM